MKGETKEVFEALRLDLIGLNADWQMLRQLFTVSDDRFEVFNSTAPGFFRLLRDMIVDDAVISLSRMTDDRADCQCFPRLVKLLRGQVSSVLHKELVSDLKTLQAACGDIRIHRNKRVAHKARSTGAPHMAPVPTKLPPLTIKQIENAMELAASLLNKVLGHFEDTMQVFEPVVRGDANALFQCLKRGYDASEAERKAALATFARPNAP